MLKLMEKGNQLNPNAIKNAVCCVLLTRKFIFAIPIKLTTSRESPLKTKKKLTKFLGRSTKNPAISKGGSNAVGKWQV